MVGLLFILCAFLWAFGDGYSDGKFCLEKTEVHWTKWPSRIGVAGFLALYTYLGFNLCVISWHILLGVFLSFWPLFNVGWCFGNGKGKNWDFIGTTSRTDRFIHWTGLVRLNKKFPFVISTIYILLTLMGLCLIHYSTVYYDYF